MKHWKYWPLQAIVWVASRMPFWVLYRVADIIFLLMYYLVRYRRKVVAKQLTDSFPEKSAKEIRRIERRFYRNFADIIVETVKLAHVSDKSMRKRMIFEGTEMVDRLLKEGKSIVSYFSHTGNWEWGPSITLWTDVKPSDGTAEYGQVYRALRDKWFDAFMLKLRGRFGSVSHEKRIVLRDLLRLRRDNIPWIIGFMSDQKPSHGDPTRVLNWLNHPTAFITGTETLARKMRAAVIYWDTHKDRRGHYRIVLRHITDDASTLPPMALTDTYAHLLERTISRDPAIWLWTHKRWKVPVNAAPSQPIILPMSDE